MTDTQEHDLIRQRRGKLDALRQDGNAYPNDFRRTAHAAELHACYDERDKQSLEEAGIEVSVAGRMMAKRVMGKSSFAPLQDGSGNIQLFLERDTLPEGVYQSFKTWDVGDIVAARGTLYKTNKGELSVRATELRLLTKSLRPLPEKYHGLSDRELRYRQRYVDLIMNEKSREIFRQRSKLISYLRDSLDALDFLEVETPMMQVIPGGAVARPFVTHHNALDMPLYLRIAPELFLKRLIVGGFDRVYEINRNFRNEGLSTRHNPEFTMLELYQAYADYEDLLALIETLMRGLGHALLGGTRLTYQDASFELGEDFARLSVADAICKYNADLDATQLRDVDVLRSYCDRIDVPWQESYGAGKLQVEIFEKTVEPHLQAPTFIIQYPAEVSPLSRANDDDPFIADRFEFFMAGRELANGFSELNDPEDQAERFRQQSEARDGGDLEAMAFDHDYIRALEYGMPPAAGLGVGIDRLVMLFTDSASIRDVLLFPHMRPERTTE